MENGREQSAATSAPVIQQDGAAEPTMELDEDELIARVEAVQLLIEALADASGNSPP